MTLLDEKILTNTAERGISGVGFLVCFFVILCEKDSSRISLYGIFCSMRNYISLVFILFLLSIIGISF